MQADRIVENTPVTELICVAKHTSKARAHRHEVFKFLWDIGGSKAGGQGTIVAVVVAAAGRTGQRVRQPVRTRILG